MELRDHTRCAACGRISRCAVGADGRGLCAECAFGVCTMFALGSGPAKSARCSLCGSEKPVVSALDVADPICAACAASSARFLAGALDLSPGTRERLTGLAEAAAPPQGPVENPPPTRRAVDLHCSFCGRHQTEVEKLIAGPDVFICDRCVAESQQALDDGDASKGLTCSFCGKAHSPSVANNLPMPSGRTTRICAECLELCGQVIAEGRRAG